MSKPYSSRLRPKLYSSNIVEIAEGSATLQVLFTELSRPHGSASVEFYSDSLGQNPVTPTAGSSTFTLRTPTQPNNFQKFGYNVLPCDVPSQAEWAAIITGVKAEINGLTGAATHCRLYVSTTTS